MMTLLGLPLGIVLLLALLPMYAIGYTTSAWLLGRAIVRPPRGRFLAFLAGWGILRAIALVPVLGVLAWLGAAVFGLGALGDRAVALAARPGRPARRRHRSRRERRTVRGTVEFMWDDGDHMLVNLEPDDPGDPHTFELSETCGLAPRARSARATASRSFTPVEHEVVDPDCGPSESVRAEVLDGARCCAIPSCSSQRPRPDACADHLWGASRARQGNRHGKPVGRGSGSKDAVGGFTTTRCL